MGEWLTTSLLVEAESIMWVETHLLTLDAGFLSLVGFCIGSGGIVLHLFGDMITVAGIRPYRPFSRHKVSVTQLRAANAVVNRGLFSLGVLAIVVVGLVLTPLGALLIDVLSDVSRFILSRW